MDSFFRAQGSTVQGLALACLKVEARGIRRSPEIRQISQGPPSETNEKLYRADL